MLTLHLEAATLPELVEKAKAALQVIPVPAAPAAPTPAAEVATLPTPPERTPRSRKKVDPPVSPEAPPAAATAPTAPSPAPAPAVVAPAASGLLSPAQSIAMTVPAPSADDVRAALRPLVAAYGGDETKAGAWMKEIGFDRVSIIPEDKRAEVIEKVKAQVIALTGKSSAPVPTVDQVREACGALNQALGMPAVTALLDQYGADRFSLLAEDKRAAFIAECSAKVAKQKELLAANAAAKAA